jgi:uncharacterized membrane protein YkoI
MHRLAATLAFALTLLAASPASFALSEQEKARAAVEAGEVLPLNDILRQVRRDYPGRILDAQLDERGGGNWVYRIKLLKKNGRVVDLTVDGSSGKVLRAKGD